MSGLRTLGARAFPTPESRAFLRWGLGAYAIAFLVLLVVTLVTAEGTLIYALDDPAIHLSVARNLVEHGTWGVTPGHFQSASSAPLWTVIVAAVVGLAPTAEEYAALVLNVIASIAVIALLARAQSTFRPSLRRPLDALAVIVLVTVVLFLPSATFVGMEHVLHLALALAAFGLLLQAPDAGRSRALRLLPYLLLALATWTRMETAFLAAGLGAALLLTVDRRAPDARAVLRARIPTVVGLGLASGIPLLAYGVVNQLMGQSWLPNSVMAKSDSLNGDSRIPAARDVLDRFTEDPVLGVLVGLCLALAVVGWRERRSWVVPATAVVVTTLLHVAFAQVGWYERYQIYLIGLALFVLLRAAPELLPGAGAPGPETTTEAPLPPSGRRDGRTPLAPLFVLMLLLFSATKVALTYEVGKAVDDTYSQRYQAALFLGRYYDGEPVATGELGYTSLEHDGPITDLYGLGDYEVLQARIHTPRSERDAYWRGLAQQRGFRVVAVYPQTLWREMPEEWVLVGTWRLPRSTVTAFDRDFQFYATVPEEVAPLIDHLEEFESELPPGIRPSINPLAEYRAAVLIDERDGP